jgi:very-short-patch-repair endonuclease
VAALAELCELASARRPGRSVLVEVLGRRPRQPPTESYLETRCVQVMRDAGLPGFDRQVELSDRYGLIGRVDPYHRGGVVELVGRAWHVDRFSPDHRRYARLTGAGYRFLPFTFDDVEGRPGHVVDAIVAT